MDNTFNNRQLAAYQASRNKPDFRLYSLDGRLLITSKDPEYVQDRAAEWTRLDILDGYKIEEV